MTGSADIALSLDIVCFADMPWDYPLWTNRQHVMSRVPQRDPTARVLYVSPPRFAPSAFRSWRSTTRADAAGSRSRGPLLTERVADRLWTLTPLLPLPNRLAQRRAPVLYDRWLVSAVRHAIGRLGFDRPILWTYTPFSAGYLGRFGERLVVYDVVDDYPTLSHYQRLRDGVVEADAAMTRRADITLHTSERVFAARQALSPDSHLVGNAADIDLFAEAQAPGASLDRPEGLTGIVPPILLFHGAVTASKLDLALIAELATAHPEWSLVFVGPVLDREAQVALSGHPNIHLVGTRRQDELPALLAAADLSIIPYRRTPYTEGINALKLYECLAAGKRVVATPLPCFEPFRELVSLASTADEFGRTITAALVAGGSDDRADRLARVRAYSWDAKVDAMLGIVRARLSASRG